MSTIIAVVSLDRERIAGGAPIFLVDTAEDQQAVAFKLEKILDATAHDLQNGAFILVKH
jgi:hypothetical protein